ncbi:phosphotransferase enzyme family protein [Virgibacillus oceani]|uniref:Aminoglycoside phosphotransferase n=1 Tax=Virgibacillus oceani TaxID=1479511 RepID=A0A917M5D1_9BACI|nr:phosphotransferase [Virgibacillus oceani]GGG79999.1 aminoglycoside phosphotransferase [Virgibacillus oceani]
MSNYDPWEDQLEKYLQIAKIAIQSYPALSQSTITLLNYSENATYLVKHPTTGAKQILRVSRPDYHTKTEIESELIWLESINKHASLHVALPIRAKNGEYIQEVTLDKKRYYCTLFTFLEGDAPDEEKESELIRQFEILGEITALLHDHSINYGTNLDNIKRLSWNYETILGDKPKWGKWQDGLAITPERAVLFQKVSEKIQARLEAFGKKSTRYGLIHSDLRLANLLVEGDQIKVIDFDDCGYGWYLYDLATSLSFIEHKSYVPGLIESWIKGYRKVRNLSQEEVQEIPTFVMMRRLQLVAWVGSRNNETTEELGDGFTVDTDPLAEKYLESMK